MKCSTAVFLLFVTVVLQRYASVDSQSTPPAKVTTLVRGSALTGGANGIIFDNRNRLHIASVSGREIVVMDREGGDILDRYGSDTGVEGPDDLIFGPDGSLYWTSLFTGEIGRRKPDGSVSVVAELPPGVNPITFSNDGQLFTALCFLGEGLYEVDPEGVRPPDLILRQLKESPVGNCTLNGMDFGPDGFLYGPRFFIDEVVKVNVKTGNATTVASGFQNPSALKFNSKGELFVLDISTGQLWKTNAKTGEKRVFARLDKNVDNLAFDSEDRLFVSNGGDGSIVEVKNDGSTRVVSKGGLSFPGGVAVVPHSNGESVWVADYLNLYEYSGRTGDVISSHAATLAGAGLAPANTVSKDGSNLLLTSFASNSVQVWNPKTRKVIQDYRDFAGPSNAIRFRGDLVVAQFGSANVVRASGDNIARRTTLVSDITVPSGLAATDQDVWVADWSTGRVLQVILGGEQLAEPSVIATGLKNPEGMAVTDDGTLLVVETGARRLVRIDPKKEGVEVVADKLDLGLVAISSPVVNPVYAFSGVAVGSGGIVYVGADRARALYRMETSPERPQVQRTVLSKVSRTLDREDRLGAAFRTLPLQEPGAA